MVAVKICGITNLKDAQFSVKSKADALGFIFYKKSPRYISPHNALSIIRQLPEGIKKIGVFANAKKKTIQRIAKMCRLDMVQLHGNETPAFCNKLEGVRVIKAFRVKENINSKKILRYDCYAFLFDAFSKTKFGGTGKRISWQFIKETSQLNRPIFLSGGLNEKNVQGAIKKIKPDWVDVSTGVEVSPGNKDCLKLKRFILKAKQKSRLSHK